MPRTCPDDATSLQIQTLRGLALDVCPECAGLYFDEGELAALQEGGTAALESVEASATPSGLVLIDCETPKRCPGCASLMCRYAYRYSSDIRLDGCPRCGGIWVQDGELAKIAAHVAAPPAVFGGVPSARAAAEDENAAATRHHSLLSRIAARFAS